MRIVLVMLVVFALFTVPLAFAEIKDKGFENRHTVRIATRSDDDDYNLYLTRLSAFVDYDSALLGRIIRISPFGEYQHEIEANTWWRKEVGAEIGTSFFNDFFYWGASFQHVWQQQENYTVEDLQETTEWESRFVFTPPLRWWHFKDKLTLRLFEEYTYDFTRGQGTINEVGVSLDWQVHEGLKLPIGWKHIDRIHDFDQDYLEFAVEFSF
ncbi:MAG: hypothetical protein ISS43_02110 [Candidatus Omnitrophica bacterium]|nr:hypothetical protein [Candidatus Omnitrophota bacterium]